MDHARLRLGELLAAAASVATFVLLFFRWSDPTGARTQDGGAYATIRYAGDEVTQSAWEALGWFTVLLVVLAILGGLAVAAAVASRRPVALPMGASVLTLAGGTLVALVLLVRVAFLDDQTAVAWLGVLATALVPVGALVSMRDERTAAPSSQRPLVPAQPAPPA